jgi:hypothetical protein
MGSPRKPSPWCRPRHFHWLAAGLPAVRVQPRLRAMPQASPQTITSTPHAGCQTIRCRGSAHDANFPRPSAGLDTQQPEIVSACYPFFVSLPSSSAQRTKFKRRWQDSDPSASPSAVSIDEIAPRHPPAGGESHRRPNEGRGRSPRTHTVATESQGQLLFGRVHRKTRGRVVPPGIPRLRSVPSGHEGR